MDVRLTLKAEGGGIVYMHYTGIRTGTAEVLARLNSGQAVDPSEYYFRTAVRFETGAAELAWMNKVVAVGVGQRPPSGPTYDVLCDRLRKVGGGEPPPWRPLPRHRGRDLSLGESDKLHAAEREGPRAN